MSAARHLRLTRRWLIVAIFSLGATLWWLTLQPQAHRDWKPEYARQPTAHLRGDEVSIDFVRDFDFRTETDFTARWAPRRVHLSALRGVDLFVSHWGNPYVAHALVSFDFGPEGYLTASVETRQTRGQSYSVWRGFFRQYQIIYLLAEERDVVALRTNVRADEELRFYRTRMQPADARRLFLAYLDWMNDNARHPAWYHALGNNCTTRFSQWLVAQGIGGISRWDWRLLFNGKADELLYERGLLESGGLSFPELRRQALLGRGIARDGFSQNLRAGRISAPGLQEKPFRLR